MTQSTAPQIDSVLQIAERQLEMLAELAEMAMAASRAFTISALASARAAEAILADKYFMPEIGRAQACGAKEAAESLQKVTRAVRLTLMLEMKVAEIARDTRAGIVTHIGGVASRKDAGGTPAVQGGGGGDLQDRRRPAVSCSDGQTPDRDRRDTEIERFAEFERPDILPRAPFRETVEQISADIGVTVDWTTWRLKPLEPKGEALYPSPPAGDPGLKLPGRSPPVPARPPG